MEALDDFDIPIDVVLEGDFAPAASPPAGVTLLQAEIEIEPPPAAAPAQVDPRIATLEGLLEQIRARRRSAAS